MRGLEAAHALTKSSSAPTATRIALHGDHWAAETHTCGVLHVSSVPQQQSAPFCRDRVGFKHRTLNRTLFSTLFLELFGT